MWRLEQKTVILHNLQLICSTIPTECPQFLIADRVNGIQTAAKRTIWEQSLCLCQHQKNKNFHGCLWWFQNCAKHSYSWCVLEQRTESPAVGGLSDRWTACVTYQHSWKKKYILKTKMRATVHAPLNIGRDSSLQHNTIGTGAGLPIKHKNAKRRNYNFRSEVFRLYCLSLYWGTLVSPGFNS